MKKIVLIICCVFSSLLSYAQSAESVWEEFQASPNSKMYTFLDGIANSSSPKDYVRYMQRFVKTCIENDIQWDALFDELKETILPKDPDVAISFGVGLAQMQADYGKIIDVLKILPKCQNFDINDLLEDAAVYTDGRIAIRLYDRVKRKYGDSVSDLCFLICRMQFSNTGDRQIFLYQPGEKSLLGKLKYAGTNNTYAMENVKENDKLELNIGVYLDSQGETVGEKYEKYRSFAAAAKAITAAKEAAEIREMAEAERKYDAAHAAVIKKYGRAAYNRACEGQVWLGMPADLVCLQNFFVKRTESFGNTVEIYRRTGITIYVTNGKVSKIVRGRRR